FGACGRRAAPPYPYSAAAPRIFVATSDGLAVLPPKADALSLAKLNGLAALVPDASVSTANGKAILVAVNRVGPVFVEPDADCRNYRLKAFPSPATFARLTAGGAWPHDGGFLVQLYRDPFSFPAASGSSAGSPLGTLLSVGETGSIQVLASSGLVSESPLGFGLFALYPASQGGWLAELRRDDSNRVETRYLSAASPEDPAPRRLSRSAFEAKLEPRPLAEAAGPRGEALRHAIAALSASEGGASWNSALIRARGADGGDVYYLDGGSIDEARAMFAWFLDDGRVMVLEQGGEAAVSDSSGRSVTLAFVPPLPDAAFTSLAVCRDLAAASWTSGIFPDLRAAGLVVAAVP
ncbi:MAG: hypothetical protein M0Z80_12160, partial [Treponema sp.]|nr:hypothetical protein [Treponema sp.]